MRAETEAEPAAGGFQSLDPLGDRTRLFRSRLGAGLAGHHQQLRTHDWRIVPVRLEAVACRIET